MQVETQASRQVARSGLRWAATGCAAAALLWCIGIGVWIWVTPIRYHGVESTAGDATAPLREYDVYRSFADVSLLGPVPLVVPALIALGAARAAWHRRMVFLLLCTLALSAFVILAGFSIGSAYLPAAALLTVATVCTLIGAVLARPSGALRRLSRGGVDRGSLPR